MPFERLSAAPRKIAVIGGGISGLGASYYLSDEHHVTLFEAEPRLGGHARTKLAGKRGDQPVDTGFIVFNYANYPLLADLFDRLDVPVAKSSMSFGASLRGGALEYGLAGPRAVFAQPKNAVNPRFLRMLRDIFRFNARALDAATDTTQSLGDFLEKLGTGPWFRDYYLLPLSGAIWSTPTEKILDFPAHALIRFFENHALLHHTGQHQWYTVEGGSREYVARLETALVHQGVEIRSGAPVAGVRRGLRGAEVRARGGAWELFDDVIFATHSDDSLKMLEDPSGAERRILGAVAYQPNRMVLHSDDRIMPKRRSVWSSWNYTEDKVRALNTIDLTYWMNSLQPIPMDDPLFVTLNSTREIREELIFDEAELRHPVYDLGALEAQEAMRAHNGTRNTWYCGAWMKNGFHEDGLASAWDVAGAIRARAGLVAAE
ncbi:cyclopropane-fatty-acyl-phospholipid synthase [Roseivivax halodurans JCM 10272]|uniref:Cyclopropane-fatty-acyl-phospholipid synthase n=1 Tax=Roseivivax halodurans JCM 10272 TaxID=1449350 RepID=X7EFS9_9RHOB|nr:FAD-dependent oxidoreductase [Roseivivax halodurans]ETX14909.1 cyclopropane-fatty-acyl-phospholipid synthase [Roseivivax halodurans JCM 10272]